MSRALQINSSPQGWMARNTKPVPLAEKGWVITMKKISIILLSAVLVFSMAACNGGKEKADNQTEKQTESVKPTEEVAMATEAVTEVTTEAGSEETDKNTSALSFLKDTVSQHKSWKVQEILAMAFDNYCKIIGYETAIPVIKEWLKSDCANTRRAVSEGLRIWTSRPYFKEHPQMAIQFLSSLKDDESEYVRKSIGNALKDISKKYPELVSNELKQWDLSSKEIKQVHKLASAYLNKS